MTHLDPLAYSLTIKFKFFFGNSKWRTATDFKIEILSRFFSSSSRFGEKADSGRKAGGIGAVPPVEARGPQ